MEQPTTTNAVPDRATRREWIGLAVLTLAAPRDTLGGALAVAQTLPAELAAALVAGAQAAFVDSIHFVAVISAIGAVATALVAANALRSVPARSEPTGEEAKSEGAA